MADVGVRIDEIENNATIKEDDLELSLSLRPSNNGSSSSSCSQRLNNNVPEAPSPASNGQILTKRDSQALRRHEAKLKRDSKRQNSASFLKNDVVAADHQEDILERRRKAPNLGFQGAASWLGWNAGGFVPYQGQNGNCSSHIEGKDVALSSGSSSGISDNYQSISGPGGNNSDAGSQSSHPHPQISPPNAPKPSTTPQLQPSSSQLDLEPNSSNSSHLKPHLCTSYSNMPELVSSSSHSSKSLEGATSFNTTTSQQIEAQSNNNKPLSDKDPNTTPWSSSPKEAKGEIGKPPKPVGRAGQQKPVFSEMPCVLTTGNGPNGKTISGFLYKYVEEVSIICVCHGASFSPAGFVEHAGGVDVEYPLRHIKVVPFPHN